MTYTTLRAPISEHVTVRELRYHVLRWPGTTASQPPLVMVHGWMDVAASFQFMVDAFSADFLRGRTLIAPDWRGYGATAWPAIDSYWFPDYLADLDFLLDHYAGTEPIDLLGHSMGGHVSMLYAGIRPERIRRLVNLEGYGLPATRSEQAPERYAQWMDELKRLHRGEITLSTYASAADVAARLMKNNPRLPMAKAQWLAQQWAKPDEQGRWHVQGDAAHKIVNAQLYRAEEAMACYARITAPTLLVESSDDHLQQVWQGKYPREEMRQRLGHISDLRRETLPDTGHMLHHDQPERLAALVEHFLT